MNPILVSSRRTSAKQIAEALSRASLLTFALMTSAASMQAVNLLTVTPTTALALTCNTATGPGTAASLTIKPVAALTGSNTIVVTFAAPTGGVAITAPSSTTLTAANSAAGLIYSVNMAGIHNGQVLSERGAPGISLFEFFQYRQRLRTPPRHRVTVA